MAKQQESEDAPHPSSGDMQTAWPAKTGEEREIMEEDEPK